MKTINNSLKWITYAASFCMAAVLLLMTGCKEDTAPSIYDPTFTGGPQPVVSSVSSSHTNVIFAGLSMLTINGSNFSANPAENLVYFDVLKATVLAASPTQLVVKVPIYVKDSVQLIVMVKGAPKYSQIKFIDVDAAVADYGKLASTEESVGLATDAGGDLYSSILNNGVGMGIRKFIIGPDTSTQYVAPTAGYAGWSGLKFGPGGLLFGARALGAIYTLSAGTAPAVWKATGGGTYVTDLDFDNIGYLWAVGNNANIYRLKVADKTIQLFPFKATLRTVRVYNGYLYVGGKQDSVEAVWRFKLDAAGTLGAAEEYFNLSKQAGYGYNGPTVNAITFNNAGDIYLGTSSSDGVLLVHPDKTFEPLFPGLFSPSIISFAWGTGANAGTLYASRAGIATVKSIVKIITLKTGAVYYGKGN